jgi:hypothetical protein
VTLREGGCDFFQWTVKVLFDGEGKMSLHIGWKKYARDHNVDIGCLVKFFYEGDDKLSVKVHDKELPYPLAQRRQQR